MCPINALVNVWNNQLKLLTRYVIILISGEKRSQIELYIIRANQCAAAAAADKVEQLST